MKNDTIEHTMRRTRRYWYVDGLWEIGYGCLFTIMGLMLYLQAFIPAESNFADYLEYGFPVLIIALVVLINWGIRKIKQHLTYPRTGMVTYRRETMSVRDWLIAALIAAGSILAGSILYALFQVWEPALEIIPVLLGFLGAVITLFLAFANSLKRFYLLAGYSILIGFVLAWIGITGMRLMGIYFIFFGIGLVFGGAFTLWNYLSETSPPQEVLNER
jgi:hypothetical protein